MILYDKHVQCMADSVPVMKAAPRQREFQELLLCVSFAFV